MKPFAPILLAACLCAAAAPAPAQTPADYRREQDMAHKKQAEEQRARLNQSRWQSCSANWQRFGK